MPRHIIAAPGCTAKRTRSYYEHRDGKLYVAQSIAALESLLSGDQPDHISDATKRVCAAMRQATTGRRYFAARCARIAESLAAIYRASPADMLAPARAIARRYPSRGLH